MRYGPLGRERDEYWYDIALICMNGHVVNSAMQDRPEHNAPRCDDCGVVTISKCPSCENPIRGHYHSNIMGLRYYAPSFCLQCGKPFPWTVAEVAAAKEMALELQLSPSEVTQLQGTIDDLMRDTPMTPVAALRFKKLVVKGGKLAETVFTEMVMKFATDTAKKLITGK